MIRVAICDDSAETLQKTGYMLTHWEAPVARDMTVELFEDADALLTAHRRHAFDVILLDIVMPLLSGMDAARELREKDTTVKIVFLTASPEFAVESYSVRASNYLLKPVDPDRLFACMEELITELQSYARAIVVKDGDMTRRILLSDIACVEAQLKHVVFTLRENRTVYASEPFYTFENTLSLTDGFFKCHRSYIVNIHHIENYSHGEIVMRTGQRIPIARSCRKSFEEAYFQVVFGKVDDDL